jgi:hypothetical protein
MLGLFLDNPTSLRITFWCSSTFTPIDMFNHLEIVANKKFQHHDDDHSNYYYDNSDDDAHVGCSQHHDDHHSDSDHHVL